MSNTHQIIVYGKEVHANYRQDLQCNSEHIQPIQYVIKQYVTNTALFMLMFIAS